MNRTVEINPEIPPLVLFPDDGQDPVTLEISSLAATHRFGYRKGDIDRDKFVQFYRLDPDDRDDLFQIQVHLANQLGVAADNHTIYVVRSPVHVWTFKFTDGCLLVHAGDVAVASRHSSEPPDVVPM